MNMQSAHRVDNDGGNFTKCLVRYPKRGLFLGAACALIACATESAPPAHADSSAGARVATVGRLVWSTRLSPDSSYDFEGAGAMDDSLLLLPGPRGLLAIRRDDGHLSWADTVWTTHPGPEYVAERAGVACFAGAGWVGCDRVAQGHAVLWGARPTHPAKSGPNGMSEDVFATLAEDGFVRAYDPRSGRLVWETAAIATRGGPFFIGGVTIADPLIIAAGAAAPPGPVLRASGAVVALRLTDGKVLWRFASPDTFSQFGAPPLVTAGLVILTDHAAGTLHALRLLDGSHVWDTRTAPSRSQVIEGDQSPVASGDTIFAGSPDTYLYAVKRDNGQLLWSHKFPASVFTVGRCGEWAVANIYRLGFIKPGTSTVHWAPGDRSIDDVFADDELVSSEIMTAPDQSVIYATTKSGVVAISCKPG